MEGWAQYWKIGVGLILLLLYNWAKEKGKNTSQPPARPAPPPAPPKTREMLPVAKVETKHLSAQNPVYIPKRPKRGGNALKKARSQRELFVLAEVMRRPYF